MNSVNLCGRLCQDPELMYSKSGVAVCRFTLAINRPFSKEKTADFLPCICFKTQAENVANFLEKGREAAVTGSIQTSSWEKDGVKHYKTEILADRVEFIGGKQQQQNNNSLGREVDEDPPF